MRIPKVLYMAPFFFGAPVLMYYTVDHKPREDVEPICKKVRSLIRRRMRDVKDSKRYGKERKMIRWIDC